MYCQEFIAPVKNHAQNVPQLENLEFALLENVAFANKNPNPATPIPSPYKYIAVASEYIYLHTPQNIYIYIHFNRMLILLCEPALYLKFKSFFFQNLVK